MPHFGGMSNRLLTQTDLAEELQVSSRLIRTWTRRRILPCIRIGRVVRYDLEKCRKALEAFETKTITRPS